MNSTKWWAQNLWEGWVVMGFPSQSQSVKLGSGAHFFKWTDINKGHSHHKQLGKHNTKKKKKSVKNQS